MKNLLYAVAVLFAACAHASAQSGFTGTWTAGGQTAAIIVLTAAGPQVTGTVADRDIYEGRTDGSTVTFKVKSPDGDRTITFTGKITGDEIAFTREVQVQDGGSPGIAGIFSVSAPLQFAARRVTFAAGTELAAAVNLAEHDVKGEGVLFLPQGVNRVRGVMVVVGWGLGFAGYEDSEWRKLAETLELGLLRARLSHMTEPKAGLIGPGRIPPVGGANAVQVLLRRLAEDSGHRELASAPLVFWGHSAGGGLISRLAAAVPQRTIAFVRYHSGPNFEDMEVLSQIPALILVGGKDPNGLQSAVEAQWKIGRSAGAPWTFAIEPNATHGDLDDLRKANGLLTSWVTAVFRQRVSPDGSLLRVSAEGSAWLGDSRTGNVASNSALTGAKLEASWLPDELSARAWSAIIGSPQ
jgi:pimeloyl-ACP methyl ester carboxylesterase